VALALSAPLKAGARYVLALDGAADDTQSFMAAFCQRNSAPSFQGGGAQVSVRDTAVVVAVVLDWPAEIEVRIGGAGDGEPCSGACVTARSQISCDVPACGPPSFACNGSVRIDGLDPASDYALRVVARDDLGFVATAPLQRFTTVAPLPRIMISEVKTSPTEGEYVELY